MDPQSLAPDAGGMMAWLSPVLSQWHRDALAMVLLLPRPFVLFMVVPFLSRTMVPGSVRRGLVFLLGMLMLPLAGSAEGVTPVQAMVIAAKEGLIGLLLGLGLGVFIWAVHSVGDLVDFHTGAANAQFFDPAFGHEGGPTGQFLGWVMAVLFVSAGGLTGVVALLAESYRIWPLAAPLPDLPRLLEAFAIHQADSLFNWIVKLGAPVLMVLMLVDYGLGLLGRFVPQFNVFVIAQPLKSLVAIFMLLICLSLLHETLLEFVRPGTNVLSVWRSLAER
ncbi:MAG TPA: type III secretion system export apparatus subunit SctT [Ideonella sp.]|uniref:type III secretion system export apparatus subunit SctT n=1 Tax=Ideonella sp. TaxID=1929293 RepID=UPI002E36B163|nr:type III secretion system export apparatus subunit SctT [Ideonella sp.]HEX5687933.1 type III secretion system export apparatus subunit SctT [Ideonella sp.]